MLRLLLAREEAEAAAASAKAAAPARAARRKEIDAALLRKLDMLAARSKREKRAEMIAWADDMVARGLAP